MPGDIIDMRSISTRNHGHLIALCKTEVCRLSPTIFESIIENNPNAQRIAWNNLHNQTYRAIDHAADLTKKQAVEKLASFIFECRCSQSPKIGDNMVDIPVRHVNIAEYLGMQPETVSRCFSDLEQRGIITFLDISKIEILNITTLRHIANGSKTPDKLHHTNQGAPLELGSGPIKPEPRSAL